MKTIRSLLLAATVLTLNAAVAEDQAEKAPAPGIAEATPPAAESPAEAPAESSPQATAEAMVRAESTPNPLNRLVLSDVTTGALSFAECEVGEILLFQKVGWQCFNLSSIISTVESQLASLEATTASKFEAKIKTAEENLILRLEAKVKSLEENVISKLEAKIKALESKLK